MKVKSTKRFKDAVQNRIVLEGEEINVSPKRATELVSLGLAVKLTQKKNESKSNKKQSK
jgi:hypothetical protein